MSGSLWNAVGTIPGRRETASNRIYRSCRVYVVSSYQWEFSRLTGALALAAVGGRLKVARCRLKPFEVPARLQAEVVREP